MQKAYVALAAALLLAAGCGSTSTASDAGSSSPGGSSGSSSGSRAGSRGSSTAASSSTASSSSSAAAGSSSSGSSSGASNALAFVGNWQVAGTYSVTTGSGASAQTNSGSSVQQAQGYTVSFALGTQSDLLSLDSYGCQVLWSVSGTTATSEPPPASCTINGGPDVLTWNTGNLTLSVVDANHLSGSLDLTGTIDDVDAGLGDQTTPASATCVGTLTRVGG